jgi:general secretion pathway protein C
LSGLVLRGVLGGGAAIIGFPDGNQRSVPIGREFLPGVTLKEVALSHVVLATASGESRLEFNKPWSEAAPVAAAAAVAKTPEAERRSQETLEYRTGLMPMKADGRIRGFALRPGANLAVFRRAGLRPGDVVVGVNGQAFRSEEKVLELSGELASARTIEVDFIRNGRKMTGRTEEVDNRR